MQNLKSPNKLRSTDPWAAEQESTSAAQAAGYATGAEGDAGENSERKLRLHQIIPSPPSDRESNS